MALRDFLSNEPTAPLTRETLARAFEQIKKRGPEPRGNCLFDGHVVALMSTRCLYCGERVRDLSVDENHIHHGEFF